MDSALQNGLGLKRQDSRQSSSRLRNSMTGAIGSGLIGGRQSGFKSTAAHILNNTKTEKGDGVNSDRGSKVNLN